MKSRKWHDLLETLKNEKLVLDWRKRQQSRAVVRLSIEEILDRLPLNYNIHKSHRHNQPKLVSNPQKPEDNCQ